MTGAPGFSRFMGTTPSVFGVGLATIRRSISRRPPQEVAASHNSKGEVEYARRETRVFDPFHRGVEPKLTNQTPLPRKLVARPMSGRTTNSTLRAAPHARATSKEPINQDREKGVERVEDPSRVQGRALPAGGPRNTTYEVTNIGQQTRLL